MLNLLLVLFVWLIVTIAADGLEAPIRLAAVLLFGRNGKKYALKDKDLPKVSVIVPTYNEKDNIDGCIKAIKAQNYPKKKLEIIVVDDGSLDGTAEQVHNNHINNGGSPTLPNGGTLQNDGKPIKNGMLTLIPSSHRGKAHALNKGIEMSKGELIINLDADVFLDRNAVRNMASFLLGREDVEVATGNIEIDWNVANGHGAAGKSEGLTLEEGLLAKCQFLEYLNAFRLGRHYQSMLGTLYSISGAFSAFKRAVLSDIPQYRQLTVSEDTDLTFFLHEMGKKVAFVPNAKARLLPVLTWQHLHSQRVRWRRGQIEVSSLHKSIVGRRKGGLFGLIGLPHTLLVDHTMGFLRLIWTFVLLSLPLFGLYRYILPYVLLLMYGFYVGLGTIETMAAYSVSDPEARRKIRESLIYLPVLPFYRFAVYFFRMSGFLHALLEQPRWGVGNGRK